MSIILKGIELPKEGEDITLEINHKGEVRVYSTELKETDTDAEAIQIPTPHGRLIDADKLRENIEEVDRPDGYTALVHIKYAPTILKAEE